MRQSKSEPSAPRLLFHNGKAVFARDIDSGNDDELTVVGFQDHGFGSTIRKIRVTVVAYIKFGPSSSAPMPINLPKASFFVAQDMPTC